MNDVKIGYIVVFFLIEQAIIITFALDGMTASWIRSGGRTALRVA